MTPDINKLLERLRTYYGDDLACRMLLMDARHALEAMAGEVERLRSLVVETSAKAGAAIGSCEVLADEVERWRNNSDNKDLQIADLTAERDRLKAALEAFVKHFGPLEDNAMLHEGVRNCYRLARKALEAKP